MPNKAWSCIGEFFNTVRYNPQDRRLNYIEVEGRQQSMGVGVEGGFCVPQQFLPEILSIPTNAIFRPRCTVLPAGDPPDAPLPVPVLDSEVAAYWLEEADTKTDASFTLSCSELHPHELAVSTLVSDKLLRNAAGGGPAIAALIARAITRMEDYAFLNGTGLGQPLGLVNSPAAIRVARAGAGAVAYADLYNMMARLIDGGSPIWICSPSLAPSLATVADTAGVRVWQRFNELFGLPLVFSRRSPALGSVGDLILVDLSYYLIKDGTGPTVAISSDTPDYFLSNRSVIKVFMAVDGAPWLSAPIAPENGTATLSPFVLLA